MSAAPVGIICAIPQELPRLARAIEDPMSVSLGHSTATAGLLDGTPVILVEAGIGKVNTAMTATLLVHEAGAGALLFSGVAGGLDPECKIGDVVVADRTLHHDAGVLVDAELRVYQAGHVPFLNPTDELGYLARPELIARARQAVVGLELTPLSATAGGEGQPPRIHFGPILGGDQYVSCERTRVRLHEAHRGLAVEMEGAALAQSAEAFDVPWLNIRALSDLAGRDSHIDFTAFAEEVAASSATVLRALLPALAESGLD